MIPQANNLGTQVRNAARVLILPLYLASQEDGKGWGNDIYLHSAKEHAYAVAVGMLDDGKSLESIRAEMRRKREEANRNITRGDDPFSFWSDLTFRRNDYHERYVAAADQVIEILDRILGTE